MQQAMANVCKYAVQDAQLRSELHRIHTLALNKKDLKPVDREFILAAFNQSLDNNLQVKVHRDGLSTSTACKGARELRSCILLKNKSNDVVTAFHFHPSVDFDETRSLSQILDKARPNWRQLRCQNEKNVISFLMQQNRCTLNQVQSSQTLDFNKVHFDVPAWEVSKMVEKIRSDGPCEWSIGEDSKVVLCQNKNNQKLHCCLTHKNVTREIVGFGNILSTATETTFHDGMYVHGMRRLVNSLCRNLIRLVPKADFATPYHAFADADTAVKIIKAMNLKTNRKIVPGSKFHDVATLLGIQEHINTVAPVSQTSTFVTDNSDAILKEVRANSLITKTRLSKETISNILLACNTILSSKHTDGIWLINSMACHEPLCCKPMTPIGQCIDIVNLHGKKVSMYTASLSSVLQHLSSHVHVQKGLPIAKENAHLLVHNGAVFAIYCAPAVISRKSLSPLQHDIEPDCVHRGKDDDISCAIARLAFLEAVCNHNKDLSPFRHAIRAVWFNTESSKTDHDTIKTAMLSYAAKNIHPMYHLSIIPYL